jgi:dihydrofolate reductase
MKKIKLYIASSLDGKIARQDGSIDWLDEYNSPDEDYGYAKFLDSVDTTVMGNDTYQQVLNLSPEFPYSSKKNYVFTRNREFEKDENVTFISENHLSFMKSLKDDSGKDIWLIGGGKVNSFFLANNLIDELILFVIPVLLGNGIPLFEKIDFSAPVQLFGSKYYDNGVMELKYNFNNA